MSDKKTGGPAFPSKTINEEKTGYNKGMTLRDYFAARALEGLLSDNRRDGNPSAYAEDAYSFADAMLKEREK